MRRRAPGGGVAAQKQRHFAQLLRGDKLPGGLFFRQQLGAGLLRVDPSAMRLSICCCTSGLAPSRADGVAGDAAARGFRGHGFGEPDHRVLGGDVGRFLFRRHRAMH